MDIQQCLKHLTVILEQSAPKKKKSFGHRAGCFLFIHFGGDRTLWVLWNAVNPGKCTHVHSHKISGSMNSSCPSMGPPGDPWTPISCSKIYIHGKISKIFSSGKKINWRQYIQQHDFIFILNVMYKWTFTNWEEGDQVKGFLLPFILYTSFWIISYSKHITCAIIIFLKTKPSKNKNHDHNGFRQCAYWAIDLDWEPILPGGCSVDQNIRGQRQVTWKVYLRAF